MSGSCADWREPGTGEKKTWRRPTLPQGCPYSTIGPEELNFRVRDGNGCGLFGVATRKNLAKREDGCDELSEERLSTPDVLSMRRIASGTIKRRPDLSPSPGALRP